MGLVTYTRNVGCLTILIYTATRNSRFLCMLKCNKFACPDEVWNVPCLPFHYCVNLHLVDINFCCEMFWEHTF